MATKKRAKKPARRRTARAAAEPDGTAPSPPTVDLPYVLSNGRIPELFSRLQSAAVPARVSVEFLRKLGFTSSNDRAFPSLLRRLGFLDSSGTPSDRYRSYRNPAEARAVLGEGIYEAYADLFAVNQRVHHLDQSQVRGIVSQVSGHGADTSRRIAATLLALAELADIPEPGVVTASPLRGPDTEETPEESAAETRSDARPPVLTQPVLTLPFRHTVEIHLPATTDISVYNAIFRSIRDNLLT